MQYRICIFHIFKTVLVFEYILVIIFSDRMVPNIKNIYFQFFASSKELKNGDNKILLFVAPVSLAS